MKTLCLMIGLMICGVCLAQVDSLWRNYIFATPPEWKVGPAFPQREWGTTHFHLLTEESLVKLWDQYKQDCWNDSTMRRMPRGMRLVTVEELARARVDTNEYGFAVVNVYDTTWVHKHYADFPDFAEWLRKGKP